MKRVWVAVVAMLVVLAGVTVAQAAIEKGAFTGTTSGGDPLGFKVTKKNKVVSFYYDAVTLNCSDGDSFDTPTGKDRIETPARVKFKITKKRKWGITARNRTTGFGWDATGKFNRKGTKASGTLKIFATFNDQNEQDPKGSVRCESGKLKFSATRPPKA
jgi:hypothetical protein